MGFGMHWRGAGLNTASEISNALLDKMNVNSHSIDSIDNNYNLNNIQISPSSRLLNNKENDTFEKEITYPLGAAIAQTHGTYIISETENGIILIDQHAAHERIVLEKIRAGFLNKNMQKQILLIPRDSRVI